VSRRQRQAAYPPTILLTTPEQPRYSLVRRRAFVSSLKRIVLDEARAGDLEARRSVSSVRACGGWRPDASMGCRPGAEPDSLARFLGRSAVVQAKPPTSVSPGGAAAPIVEMLDYRERLPWAGNRAPRARRN